MTPRIVAPFSRMLAVADRLRSVNFYQNVLGFSSASDGALVRGPARLDISQGDSARDSTLQPRPRGAAILFLLTDDVEGLRREVLEHGGAPSELEKVNWIKMRVFQVADPDGHVVWFAQSFHQPDGPEDEGRQLREALPSLPLADVAAGIRHYVDKLGFHINYAQDDLGVMSRDDVTVLLIPRRAKHSGIAGCEFYIKDADVLHAELTGRGANVQGAPVSHPWGLRDFTVLDLEGNELVFAETFE